MTEGRGCGDRESGVYLTCTFGPGGVPYESCLLCPPVLLPEGMNARTLANHPTLYQGEDEVNHVVIWIGEEHYPWLPDVLEEGKRLGFSRRISPGFPFHLLTPGRSRMMMCHPKAYNEHWRKHQVPLRDCLKRKREHKIQYQLEQSANGYPLYPLCEGSYVVGQPEEGPCLSKCYDLLPKEVGEPYPFCDVDMGKMSTLYLRQIGSTVYSYIPTGEDVSGLVPAFWGMFPISGVDFIAGHPDERYQQQWENALARVKAAGFKAAIITIDEKGEERVVEEIEGART